MIPWHRLFGLGLRDEFEGTPWEERLTDLSREEIRALLERLDSKLNGNGPEEPNPN